MVIIAANQDTIFARLCKAMGREDMIEDPKYVSHVARGTNQTELDIIINDWSQSYTMAELEDLMIEHAVPVGKVFRAPDMLEDEHYAAREALIDMPSDRFETVKMQNVFPKMSKTQGEVQWAGPETLGQHNEEVLTELLDLTPVQVEKLRKSNII